jgi:asparagine synthase (glutamine-hydrolysing)
VADELRVAGVERPLETFSIGFEGSEDLRHARMVAEWIDSKHHEIIMTPDEFFAAIPEVVHAIESFDITTVRASVGNYLVSRAIRERSDCKVVFNGDGADEIFGSYLYFYKAPSDQEFERETQRLLGNIHYFDVLRSDRSISSHGLEPRTPFLDKSFVATAMSMPTKWRRPGTCHGLQPPICEKWLLRRAFEDSHLLPPEVLWRRKEAFSDGVSGPVKSWYEEIQERVSHQVPDNWKDIAADSFAKPTEIAPKTAEAFYYRHLFSQKYKGSLAKAVVPFFWMPRWIEGASDPSARTLAVYKETEKVE